MNSFRLVVIPDRRDLPAGVSDLLQSDALSLDPPRWADSLVLSNDRQPPPDAMLLILGGPPSAAVRNSFFHAFRRSVPIAALCYGKLPEGDTIVLELTEMERCWSFSSPAEGRQLILNQVQDWISDLRRETFPFPQGDELIRSYGSMEESPVNEDIYARAREVFLDRGVVCLSGFLGAGKTTLARRLLIESAGEGLNPIEIITKDLDVGHIERLLTGAEDCAVFLDLDTLRRMVPIYPARFWSVIISMIIRATESRRRLILATSFSSIASIFDQYSSAHIRLPEPGTDRQWRLQQGREAMEWYGSLEPVEMAGLLLLAAFDPIVPEAVFKRTLFSLWERLLLMESGSFPTLKELERLYSRSLAFRSIEPFRRIYGGGEGYIATTDTMKMWAVDETVRRLLRENSPVMRVLSDTLFESTEPGLRRAGYFLAGFYTDLPLELRSRLLLNITSEESRENMQDVIHTLLRSPGQIDSAVAGLCRRLMATGSTEVKAMLAEPLGRPWVVDSPELADLVEATSRDPEPRIRAGLLRGLTMWGVREKGEPIFSMLMQDEAPEVRSVMLLHLGTMFPDLNDRELSVVNSALEGSDPLGVVALTWGLLNRRAEDLSPEFHDLLWVLISRLSKGGKGRLAWQIGARLKLFRREVRELLLEDLDSEDLLPVTQCMMMNYPSLEPDEKERIWQIVNDRVTGDRAFAGMVLSYFRMMEEPIRKMLLHSILSSGRHEGLDALSQLIQRGRTDLKEASLDEMDLMISTDDVEARSWLPVFLIWNRTAFGERGSRLLERVIADPSPQVRKALARAVRLLGDYTAQTARILSPLASDPERSVRAEVGVTLGEFPPGTGGEASVLADRLLKDADPFVRAGTVSGMLRNTLLSGEERSNFVLACLDDASPEVKLEVIRGLSRSSIPCSGAGIEEKLVGILNDSDRNVRLEAIRLVTGTPALLTSDILRKRIPDILLDRQMTGPALAEELSMARKIQLDLLPDQPPVPERYDIEIFYRPAREVGGDYYDFFMLPGRNMGIAIADVVGKGIPAALTMASLKGNLDAYVKSLFSINEIISRVNASSISSEGDPILTGLFYAVLDLDSAVLTYVNAGHNPPILVRREGKVTVLDTGGLILGLIPDTEYIYGTEKLEPGDVLVLYTDGLTEAMSPDGTEFGLDGLTDLVLTSRDLSAREIVTGLLDSITEHSSGTPQGDDQTLVVVKYR